jgi:hypothetical protein
MMTKYSFAVSTLGLGYTMMALVAIITIYYNVVVAQALYFLFASMQSTLPWAKCGEWWNTCYCRTGNENGTDLDPLLWFNTSGLNCSRFGWLDGWVEGGRDGWMGMSWWVG